MLLQYLLVITSLLTAAEYVITTQSANITDDLYLKSCGSDRTILLRRRRFLTFPPRSELLFRISLLKATPWKTVVFTIHEIDVQVPIPENLHAILFEKGTDHRTRTSDEGTNLFLEYFSSLVQYIGFDGRACVHNLICDLSRVKSHFLDRSFLLRVLQLLFRPDLRFGVNFSARRDGICSNSSKCPVSLIPDFMMETVY